FIRNEQCFTCIAHLIKVCDILYIKSGRNGILRKMVCKKQSVSVTNMQGRKYDGLCILYNWIVARVIRGLDCQCRLQENSLYTDSDHADNPACLDIYFVKYKSGRSLHWLCFSFILEAR